MMQRQDSPCTYLAHHGHERYYYYYYFYYCYEPALIQSASAARNRH